MGCNIYAQPVCEWCALDMDDEDHAIFTCAAYNHLRERYADYFGSNHHDLRGVLEQTSMQKIALFLTECRALSLKPKSESKRTV